MRAYHRWFGAVAALLLAFIALSVLCGLAPLILPITGLAVYVEMLRRRRRGGRRGLFWR